MGGYSTCPALVSQTYVVSVNRLEIITTKRQEKKEEKTKEKNRKEQKRTEHKKNLLMRSSSPTQASSSHMALDIDASEEGLKAMLN